MPLLSHCAPGLARARPHARRCARRPADSLRRLSAWLPALLFAGAAHGCGTDAERPYAGLSRAVVERPEAGYVVRYLAPPWQRVSDDPLAVGTRKMVTIGGMGRELVAGSGVVLEIERISSSDVVDALAFPKYRLEAALVVCSADELEEKSCAEHLAALDYAARQEEGAFDLFGSAPRARRNDWDQRYYELMGQSEMTGRFRRVVFFEGAERPDEVAGWLQLEANPDLGEREVSELVRAVQMLPGSGAEP